MLRNITRLQLHLLTVVISNTPIYCLNVVYFSEQECSHFIFICLSVNFISFLYCLILLWWLFKTHYSCFYKPIYAFHILVSEVIQELHQDVNKKASLELSQPYNITKQWKVSPLISGLSSLEWRRVICLFETHFMDLNIPLLIAVFIDKLPCLPDWGSLKII